MGITFDYCQLAPQVDTSELNIDVKEICVAIRNVPFRTGTRNCQHGETPVLDTIEIELWEEKTDIFGNDIVGIEISIWFGRNPDTGCWWFGQEDAGVCVNFCEEELTQAQLTALAEEFARELEESEYKNAQDLVSDYGWGLIAVVVVAAAAYAATAAWGGSIIGGFTVA